MAVFAGCTQTEPADAKEVQAVASGKAPCPPFFAANAGQVLLGSPGILAGAFL